MIFMMTTAAVTIVLILTIFFCFYKSRPTLTLYAIALSCSVSSVLALALGNLHVASITLPAFVACGFVAPMFLSEEEAWQSLPRVFLAWMLPGLPILLAAVAEVIVIGLLHQKTQISNVFITSLAIVTGLIIFVPTMIAFSNIPSMIRSFARHYLHH